MAAIFNPSNNLSYSNPQKPHFHSLRRAFPLALFSHLEKPQTPNQTSIPDHKLVVVGGSKLSGHVDISGSKNSALAVLAGTLCCSGTSKLHNIPNLSDIRTMVSILKSLGARIEASNGEMTIETDGIRSVEPCSDEVGTIRGGFFVVGPLLARFGEAIVALPGGCDIGARPIDLYIRGLRALGAVVELKFIQFLNARFHTIGRSVDAKHDNLDLWTINTSSIWKLIHLGQAVLQWNGKVHAHAANGKGLIGGRFHLDYPSVGATETLMMAACMADGVTVLSNVAQEPEVADLARFLTDSGAHVEGVGSRKLIINGRNWLHGPEYTIIPDRIEAGTFMLAAAITRSCISMSPVIPCHLSCLTDKLSAVGCKISHCTHDTLEISAVPANIQGFDVKTGPFPWFPTDLQPQIMALLTTCNGSSIVEESVFEERMGHVRELQKFGARIQVCGSTALVFGKEQGSALYGSHVAATDLRGGASLVLAGLAAEGMTEINGISHVDRGYENLEIKLQFLGADIKRLIHLPVSYDKKITLRAS
ncbi:hypothetical protein HHK36_005112 [Tetracentron sinense]|uniref:UDP-N-acetylglucosamine 1-carboxyvinyltransferase n=1 Tax=Tetracentron sinense TaxID=13715 RepID=A0A834ZKC2_TETSI|nr:hypothetical protein HHK36_005112 [Tetracentron sinense]